MLSLGSFGATPAARLPASMLRGASRKPVPGAQGKKSKDFAADLGYLGSVEIVHRDNIALLSLSQRSRKQIPDSLPDAASQVRHSTAPMQSAVCSCAWCKQPCVPVLVSLSYALRQPFPPEYALLQPLACQLRHWA